MLTAFILANDDAKALTRTLNAMIGATVDGLLREVFIVADTNDESAAKLADHAGCELVSQDAFSAAIKAAKGEWLLVLEAGAMPEQGWEEGVSNHIQSGGGAARFTRSPLAKRGCLSQIFQREQPLALGLTIQKNVALTLGENAIASPANLANAVRPKAISAALRPALSARPNEA